MRADRRPLPRRGVWRPRYAGDGEAAMDDQRVGRPVIVGVDGSPSALQAVRWAAREAGRRRAPLRLVAAVGWVNVPHQYGDPRTGTDTDLRTVVLRRARAHLMAAAAVAADAAAGREPELEVLDGFPVARLADESRAAQLVVIGDRGLGGVAGLLVGSVAVGLAAQGSCPVVVVRGRADATSGPVVVGVDGSAVSEAALAFAFEAAAVRRAPLLAVHTWRELLIDPVPVLDWLAVEQAERAVLGECLAGWGEKYPDVDVQRLVMRERPARALVEQSAQAQLVVVGSHGRGGVAGLVLGSVSHAVLHRAHCPVAIVRTDAGAASR